MRFLQAYANSAVCTATRTALITGRYQYRLRLGLERALARKPRCWASPRTPDVALAFEESWLRHDVDRQVASGFSAKFGPLKSGYDHFYGFRSGALDYFSHTIGGKDDLWDDDVAIHQVGYLTGLLGSRAVTC